MSRLIIGLVLAACGMARLGAQEAAKVPMTPAELLARNLGPRDHINDPFPPYKIIGNLYFVGTAGTGFVSGQHARRV